MTAKCFVAVSIIPILITSNTKAATLTSTTVAPTPNGADIYNVMLPSTSSDLLNGDRPAVGQTFLTLGNSTGYSLSALTVYQTRTVSTSGGTWNFRLGTVSGTSFAPIATDSITLGGSALSLSGAGNDWITFTLSTPIELDPSTLYGVDLVRTGPGNFLQWGENNNANYLGGQSYTSPPNGAGGLTINLDNLDRIFLLDLTQNPPPVPEPSTLLLAVLGLIGLAMRRRKAS